ncbi:MAG: MgtC/SapB family protein [Thermodesulfobacteriota bacterium]
MITVTDILYRLAVAAALGFAIGYERELHGRSAGMKTQVIVAVSSCLLMLISLEMEDLHLTFSVSSVVRLDPGRIGSYAVAGMGFLGAGAIIQGRGSVQGLTTAACLWAGNAIGLSVGGGFILPAVSATCLILLILIVLSPLGEWVSRDRYLRVYLDFDTCGNMQPQIKELLSDYQVKILHTGFDCRFASGESRYEVAIRLKSTQNWDTVMDALRRLEGLTGLKWTEGYVP